MYKLLETIISTNDIAAMHYINISNVYDYASKLESDMYEMANSQSEYLNLLTKTVNNMKKEFEEKNQKRTEQDQHQKHQQRMLLLHADK